ncbi:MAG: hypothetical protein AAB225_22760 [Acidobacteriota bacterium]
MIDLAKLKESLGLEASLGTLRELHDEIHPVLEKHDPAEQQALLGLPGAAGTSGPGHFADFAVGDNVSLPGSV